MPISNVNTKTLEELLEEFASKSSHNTLEGEQYTAAITTKSANRVATAAQNVQSAIIKLNSVVNKSEKDLEESIRDFKNTVEKIGESSDRLSGKLLWLNIILTIATVIASLASLIALFK